MIRVVHHGSGSWFFTHPGSRIQGSKRHRMLNPDPQHCVQHTVLCLYYRDVIPFVNAALIDEAETKKQKKQKEGGTNKGDDKK